MCSSIQRFDAEKARVKKTDESTEEEANVTAHDVSAMTENDKITKSPKIDIKVKQEICFRCDKAFCEGSEAVLFYYCKNWWRCQKCSMKFRHEKGLRQHDDHIHHKGRFECPHCDKILRKDYIRDRHLVEKHRDLEKDLIAEEISCDFEGCTKIFATKALVRNHRAKVHGK